MFGFVFLFNPAVAKFCVFVEDTKGFASGWEEDTDDVFKYVSEGGFDGFGGFPA